MSEFDCIEDLGTLSLTLLDLPDDVLAHVLSCGLTSPSDLARTACTGRRLRSVAREAPLRISLISSTNLDGISAREAQRRLRLSVRSLCATYLGVSELILSHSVVEDKEVDHALHSLQALASLYVDGCKKLTPTVVKSVASAPALRSLFMQRCFQMRADPVLGQLLQPAHNSGSRLTCLALSHLDLSDWSLRQPGCASNLRALALHNCTKLTRSGLISIVAACPLLEILCLGGCTLELVASTDLQMEALSLTSSDEPSAGTPTPDTAATAGSHDVLLRKQLAQVAANMAGGPQCGYAAWLCETAIELAMAAANLPHLQVIEITFCAPALASTLQHILSSDVFVEAHKSSVQVWDFCADGSVDQALIWQRAVDQSFFATSTTCQKRGAMENAITQPPAVQISPRDARALLQAIVRCSSPGRVTPLHAAAEEGNVWRVAALLDLGADVSVRDRSGASPLFCACEAGHLAATKRLLAAGADATARNAAGEAPLYIAALRGHDAVVESLLEHFALKGIDWRASHLYGDAWTPLHAAACGGRLHVAQRLLAAAGSGAAQLVHSVNRWGQNALHVAARKGSPALLEALLEAGGGASLLSIADADGRTAADLARRNGNAHAWRLLATGRLEQQRLRGTTPTVEKSRKAPSERQQGGQWVGRRLQQRRQAARQQS